VEVSTSVSNPVGPGLYILGCKNSSKMEIRNEYRISLKKKEDTWKTEEYRKV
jgi:hypothetical protein